MSKGKVCQVALGFRAHSGWAMLVAVSGRPGSSVPPSVLLRRRVELADPKMAGSIQPYHAVRKLPVAQAQEHLERCTAAGRRLASEAVSRVLEDLRKQGYRVDTAGLLVSSARPLPELPAILASHPLLHTAEGEMFRQMLADAGAQCGLAITRIKERELLESFAARFRFTPVKILRMLADLGRGLPPPWRQDEKYAALAAWLSRTRGPA